MSPRTFASSVVVSLCGVILVGVRLYDLATHWSQTPRNRAKGFVPR